jgi:hypothetical protein
MNHNDPTYQFTCELLNSNICFVDSRNSTTVVGLDLDVGKVAALEDQSVGYGSAVGLED